MRDTIGCNLLVTPRRAVPVAHHIRAHCQWRRRHSLCRATGMTICWQ